MKKIYTLFVLLGTLTIYAQTGKVGINTETPTETFDVNGTVRIRVANQMTMAELAASDSILVVSSTGVVKRIASVNVITQAANAGSSGILPVKTDGTVVVGDGTNSNEITLGQQGATSGQFLAWNGTSWIPTTLSVAGVETVTVLKDNNNGTFTYTDENNNDVIISKASLTDNSDGTYTFSNGSSSDVTFNINDADSDSTNEIQTLSISGNDLTISGTGGNTITLPSADGSETQVTAGTNISVSGSGTSASPYVINNTFTEVDGDTTNELQTLSQTGTDVTLSNGGGTISVADNDNDPANENQTVSQGTGISVTQTGQDFQVTNTAPDQTVALTGNGATTISGTYPNFTISSTDNVDDADADATNELQTLSQSGTDVTLSNGGGTISVADNDNDPANENQTVSAGTGITVTQSGQDFEVVNSAPDQTVALTGNGATTISGTYPNFTISSTDNVDDADSDSTNEIQTLSISGNDLTISGTGGNTITLPSSTETNTTLSQNTTTSVITYTNEAGTNQTANVVSANTDNKITVGTDGGAYLGPIVYHGTFTISSTGSQNISGLPFEPSSVTFVAYSNIDSSNINTDSGTPDTGGAGNNIQKFTGSMNGFAMNSGAITQQVISNGLNAHSPNDISKYASSSHCIGIRYGNQNGGSFGLTTASLSSFNSDGFTLNVDNAQDSVLVMYTAYR